MDDIIVWGLAVGGEHREGVGVADCDEIFLVANKATCSSTSIEWCGKTNSGEGVKHEPERIEELAKIHTRKAWGELLQFMQAASSMRTSLVKMAEVTAR